MKRSKLIFTLLVALFINSINDSKCQIEYHESKMYLKPHFDINSFFHFITTDQVFEHGKVFTKFIDKGRVFYKKNPCFEKKDLKCGMLKFSNEWSPSFNGQYDFEEKNWNYNGNIIFEYKIKSNKKRSSIPKVVIIEEWSPEDLNIYNTKEFANYDNYGSRYLTFNISNMSIEEAELFAIKKICQMYLSLRDNFILTNENIKQFESQRRTTINNLNKYGVLNNGITNVNYFEPFLMYRRRDFQKTDFDKLNVLDDKEIWRRYENKNIPKRKEDNGEEIVGAALFVAGAALILDYLIGESDSKEFNSLCEIKDEFTYYAEGKNINYNLNLKVKVINPNYSQDKCEVVIEDYFVNYDFYFSSINQGNIKKRNVNHALKYIEEELKLKKGLRMYPQKSILNCN